MGFNYLQTDDRDDYFTFNNKKAIKSRVNVLYTITDIYGNILLANKNNYECRKFVKNRFNLTES